jgi:hypothetical protein
VAPPASPPVAGFLGRLTQRRRTGNRRESGPQLGHTGVTAIANVARTQGPRLCGHGAPHPWPVGLLLPEALYLRGCHLQTAEEYSTWGHPRVPMELGEPWAVTGLAPLLVLFSRMAMTRAFASCRTTGWTRLAHHHRALCSPGSWRCFRATRPWDCAQSIICITLPLFELVGTTVLRRRLQAAVARGLSPFVRRQPKIEALQQALARAGAGQGQVVALLGEPGVGKSRLVYEFLHSYHTQGWLRLESSSVSYGKATAYLLVCDLLKAYCHIEDRADLRTVRAKVTGQLLTLDENLQDTVPAVLALFEALPADNPFLQPVLVHPALLDLAGWSPGGGVCPGGACRRRSGAGRTRNETRGGQGQSRGFAAHGHQAQRGVSASWSPGGGAPPRRADGRARRRPLS